MTETYWKTMQALDEEELRRIGEKQDRKASAARTILERRRSCADAFPKIDYRDLVDLVERISFPKWTRMRIQWKCGLTSEADITLRKETDHPFPMITQEVLEHKTTYVLNGVPLLRSNPSQLVRSMKKVQQEILHLLILEPNDYEADVPHVYGTKCVNRKRMEQGEAE